MNQDLPVLNTSPYPFFFYLLLFFFFLLYVWFNKLHQHRKYNFPPSPWKLPIIGNLHQLHGPPHHVQRALAKKHGPLLLLHLGRVPTLLVSSAKMAREIMKTYDHVFSSRPNLSIAQRLFYGKDIVAVPYGEYWRQVRKVCVLQLLSAKKVQSFRVVREEEIELMLEKINVLSSSSKSVNLSKMFSSLANNVICRVALGRMYCDGEDGRRFQEMLDEMGYLLGTINIADFIPWLAWMNNLNGLNARVEKNFHELDSFLDEVVEEHINKKKRNGSDSRSDEEDFVDVLLGIEKEKTLGITFARDNVKAIVLDMFAAGTDTTSIVLEWAMSELLKQPETLKEAQEEVRRIAKGKLILTEDDNIDSMHYIKAVIKETLRLHPPIPIIILESTEKTKIQGYDIPARATVFINAYAIGRDPMSWEEPERFWPERFMSRGGGGASLIDFRGQDFELIPFGAGRRGCPGTTFAAVLMELALANLLNMYDWRLPDGMETKDLDMDETVGLSAHRKTSLVVSAIPHYV